jgi:hypothetical protein
MNQRQSTADSSTNRIAWTAGVVALACAAFACSRGAGAAAQGGRPDGGAGVAATAGRDATGFSPGADAGGAAGSSAAGADGGLRSDGPIDEATPDDRDSSNDAAAAGTTYEAEDAFFTGAVVVETTPAGSSGTGVVGGWRAPADGIVFTVAIAGGGPTRCRLRYRSTGGPTSLAIRLNGDAFGATTLAPSDALASHDDTLPLRAGLNTIGYTATDAASGFAVDALIVEDAGALAARGATMPFITYEAEDGRTNGALVGPGRTFGTVAAEASQRRAVRLETDGAYLEQTSTAPANAIVVRFSMPDAPTGGGLPGRLAVYVGPEKRATIALSSTYAWVYGGYPYGNDPAQGAPHRYFDEARATIGDVPAGAVVRLQREPGDAVPDYVVDLFELEQIPLPYTAPPGALSIDSYGATAGDGSDDAAAMRAAIAAAKAQGKPVWIPRGDYSLNSRVDVAGVTVRGAGPWYSVLHGSNGKGGFNGTGAGTVLADFAMFGDVTYRDDANFDAGLDGTLGPGSLVQNVWFEHTKVGIWTIGGDTALIVGCRIRDTFADGINLTRGTQRTRVEQVSVRNTGDDGIALWSTGSPDTGNIVRFSTVTLPMLANGIALYGGTDNAATDDIVADTVVAAAGIAVSTRAEFGPLPFAGTTRLERNTLTRTGGYEPNWMTAFGGLWIFADASALSGLTVREVQVLDSTFQGLLISGSQRVDAAGFERVDIQGAGEAGIQIASPGTGTFTSVKVSGAAKPSSVSAAFTATKDPASTGW